MVDSIETNQQPTESPAVQPQDLDSVLNSVINTNAEITVDNNNNNKINKAELPNTQSSDETVNNLSIDQSENTEVNDDNISNNEELSNSDNDSVIDTENDSLEVQQPDTDITDTTNTKTLEAPATWTESQREKFADLPIEQQEFVLEREKDTNKTFTQKTQELAEQRKGIENIINVLQPYTQQIQSSGIGVGEYIARLLQHDVQLRTDPQRALTQLAQAYNVNLGTNTSVDDNIWTDDTDQQIHPQIQSLQRQLGDTQAQLQSMQNQSKQEQYQSTLDEVERFAGIKDTKTGNLKYPHFDQLRESMGRLIHSGESKDLESAYTKALRLDDNLYNKQLELARNSVSKQEEAKRKNAVSKAKKAGSNKNPATPPTGSMQLSSLDDVLKNAIGS